MIAEQDSPGSPARARPRLPCLDGLRALSIGLVLLDHGRQNSRYNGCPRLNWIPFTGTTGVCLFLIISGFLITTLLLDEQERYGAISLRRFYVRRSLRIFPAFYCFVGAALVLRSVGLVQFSQTGLLSSATYWRNFFNGHEWTLDHTWSLSIEEQFYLMWPLLVARLPRRRAVLAACVFIVFWPLLRLVRHGFLFSGSGFIALQTAAMDTILFGSLLALLGRGRSAPFLRRIAHHWSGLIVPVVSLWGIYALARRWPESVTFLLPLIRNVSLTWLLWWCVNNSPHPFGRFLQWRLVRGIGLMSYSLYLWQQLFFGFFGHWICPFPCNLVAAFSMAALSFYLIERPLNHYRSRWSPAGEQSVFNGRPMASSISQL